MENHVFKKIFTAAWTALLLACCQLAAAAPSVNVTASASNPTAPATVTLAVTATSDGNPVMATQVEYFNGSTSLGASVQTPFTLTLDNLAAGTYQITAKVTTTDPANPVLQSAPLAVTVGTPPGAATAYFIHTDQLNTPRVITNGSGNLVWQWESDPFGKDAPNEQPAGQPAFTFNQRFAGQQFDRESNLHYNYQRDYDPQIGRYVQSDPLGLGGGINTFSYALGNPVRYADPTGEFVPLVIGGVCAAGGCEALFAAAATAAAWWGISHQPRTTVAEPSIPDPIANSGSGAQSRSRSPGATKDCPPGNSDPCEEIRRQIRDIEGKLASKRRQLELDPYKLYTRAYSVNPGGDLAGKGTYVGHMEQISGLEVGLARKKAEAAAMGCL
jgi:RHS repeat-associated protein